MSARWSLDAKTSTRAMLHKREISCSGADSGRADCLHLSAAGQENAETTIDLVLNVAPLTWFLGEMCAWYKYDIETLSPSALVSTP
jgi:hypothetical protein